jgi:hypothetical protein
MLPGGFDSDDSGSIDAGSRQAGGGTTSSSPHGPHHLDEPPGHTGNGQPTGSRALAFLTIVAVVAALAVVVTAIGRRADLGGNTSSRGDGAVPVVPTEDDKRDHPPVVTETVAVTIEITPGDARLEVYHVDDEKTLFDVFEGVADGSHAGEPFAFRLRLPPGVYAFEISREGFESLLVPSVTIDDRVETFSRSYTLAGPSAPGDVSDPDTRQ